MNLLIWRGRQKSPRVTAFGARRAWISKQGKFEAWLIDPGRWNEHEREWCCFRVKGFRIKG